MNNASILTVLVISLFSCGQKADVYTLHSQDITLTVTNYGARVMSLRTPDKNGALENIVVGHKTYAYERQRPQYRQHGYPQMTARQLDHIVWSWQKSTTTLMGK